MFDQLAWSVAVLPTALSLPHPYLCASTHTHARSCGRCCPALACGMVCACT